MKARRTRSLRAALISALCVACVVGVSACGSGSGSGGDSSTAAAGSQSGGGGSQADVAQAKAAVARAEQPIARWAIPTASPGPVPAGKKVVVITCGNTAPLCLRAGQGVVQAAQTAGWSAQLVDGKQNPSTWASAIDTAVTSGADAIVLAAAQPGLVPQAVAKAKAAGIPVVGTVVCDYDADQLVKEDGTPALPPGVTQEVEQNRWTTGYALGQWVVAHAPKGAQVLELKSPEFNCLKRATAGFEAALGEAGIDIVQSQDSPIADIGGSGGEQRIAAMFRSHPDARYIWTMSESWAGAFQQAIQATGRTDVTALGVDGDFFMPQMRKGTQYVMAGPDTNMYGYSVVDSLIRQLNHKPLVPYALPFQMIDTDSVPATGSTITAKVDFQQQFKDLWGVQ